MENRDADVFPRSGSCRILSDKPLTQNIDIAEMFAGHMGGWTFALRSFPNWKVQWSLDNDLNAIHNYALNHKAMVIETPQDIPESFLGHSLAGLHDVTDSRWVAITMRKSSDVWTSSFPCQPWSRMGNGKRTNSADGQVLLTELQSLRLASVSMLSTTLLKSA